MSLHRDALKLALLSVLMFGFGFALVPLYGMVCDSVGIQRTPAIGQPAENPAPVAMPTPSELRQVVVRFDANVLDELPWEFGPSVRQRTVRVGEVNEATYRVRNLTHEPRTAQAVVGITPWQAAEHFIKVQCFCYEQQSLKGAEQRELSLRFMVSPALPPEIDNLTVSYTFMGLRR